MEGDGFQIKTLLVIFSGSALLSLILVRIGIVLAHRAGFVKRFNPITQDKRSIALGGGISFGIVILSASAVLCQFGYVSLRVPLALSAVFALGVVDDLKSLSPLQKLIGEVAAAVVYLMQAELELWMLPIAILFLVSAQNAWNLIDVMDGLAGWITAICFVGVALITLVSRIEPLGMTLLMIAATGAVLGFLKWNTVPAKVFMGDAGSLMLGMLFGLFILEVVSSDPLSAGVLLITGLIPFFETTFLVIERSLKRIPIFLGSSDHFALRLKNCGFSEPEILCRVVVAGVGLTGLGMFIAMNRREPYLIGLILAIVCFMAVLAFRYFHSLPCKGDRSES